MAVPILDRHRSGRRRFSFCICRPVISGCFLTGWDYNPSVICFANATSLCTREAFVTAGVIMITVGADIIRPFLIGWD